MYPADWLDVGSGMRFLVIADAHWAGFEIAATECVCQAGDAVLFDTMAPHATRQNHSPRTRWAIVFWGGVV